MPGEDKDVLSIETKIQTKTRIPSSPIVKRGRPRKGLNFIRKTERWKPVEWRPEYTEIVALSATGISNVAISQMKNVTPQHVSNILNTEQAKQLRTIINQKWVDKLTSTLPDTLTKLQVNALNVISRVLESEEVIKKNPIALLKESIAVLKGTGLMKNDATVINNNNTNTPVSGMSDALLSTIADALESGKRVDEKFAHLPKDKPRLVAG